MDNWYSDPASGQTLTVANWEQLINHLHMASPISGQIVGISGNYAGHSSNSDIHFPSSQIRPWLNAHYQGSGTGTGGSGQHYSYGYSIYRDGDVYKAQSGLDGSVASTDGDAKQVIQYAIDNSYTDSIYLHSGTFIVSEPIKLKNRVRLFGAGRNVSIIQLSSNADDYILSSASDADYTEIKDIQFDLNGGNNTGEMTHGIFMLKDADYISIHNCTFAGNSGRAGTGVYLEINFSEVYDNLFNLGQDTSVQFNGNQDTLSRNYFIENASLNTYVRNSLIYGNKILTQPTGMAIQAYQDTAIIGNYLETHGNGAGIYMYGTPSTRQPFMIEKNFIAGAKGPGIELTSTFKSSNMVIIQDNTFKRNAYTSADTRAQIEVGSNIKNAIIKDNLFYNLKGTDGYSAILIDTGAENSRIEGNWWRDEEYVSGALLNLGTNTYSMHTNYSGIRISSNSPMIMQATTPAGESVYTQVGNTSQEWTYGMAKTGGKFFIKDETADTYPFKISSGGVQADTIYMLKGPASKGYVGIGTNSPQAELHVMGTISCQVYKGPSTGGTGGSGQNYGYDAIVYKDGGNYKVQKGTDGSNIVTNSSFAYVMNYLVSASSHPGGAGIGTAAQRNIKVYIPSGTYDVDSTICIANDVTVEGSGRGTNLEIQNNIPGIKFYDTRRSSFRDFTISMPTNYTSEVISLICLSGHRVRYNDIENIKITWASGWTRSGTAIYVYASGNSTNGSYQNILYNNFRNIHTDAIASGLVIETGDQWSWINGNSFEDIYFNGYKVGVDFVSPDGLTSNGINRNTFRSVKMQSQSRTLDGFRNVQRNGNVFIDCFVWDFGTASSPNYSWSIDDDAVDTLIFGCGVRIGDYQDNGTRTSLMTSEENVGIRVPLISCQTYHGPSTGGTGGSGQNYAYDYIIYKDGSNYKAQNGTTGEVDITNSDADDVFKYAVDRTPSGMIYIAPAHYYLSDTLYISSSTLVKGAGIDNTYIWAYSSADPMIWVNSGGTNTGDNYLGGGVCDMTLRSISVKDMIYIRGGPGGMYRYKLHDLKLHTPSSGIFLYENCYETSIRNIRIQSSRGKAIYVSSQSNGTVIDNVDVAGGGGTANLTDDIYIAGTDDCNITHCYLEKSNYFGGNHIVLDNSKNTRIYANEIGTCKSDYANSNGILIKNTSRSNTIIANVFASLSGTCINLKSDAGSFNEIRDNHFYNQDTNFYPAVNIDSSYNSVIGNTFNPPDLSGIGPGLSMLGNDNLVANNLFCPNGKTQLSTVATNDGGDRNVYLNNKFQHYNLAIQLDNTCKSGTIIGNDFRLDVATAITDSTTNTTNYIRDNIGYSQNIYDYISSQKIHASSDISSSTGLYANFISANNTNLSVGATGGSGQNYSYNYAIYREGDTYKAQSGTDGSTAYTVSNISGAANLINQVTSVMTDGGHIYIKSGNYVATGNMTFTNDIRVEGAGYGTKFVFPSGDGTTTDWNGNFILSGSNIEFGNLQFTGRGQVYAWMGSDYSNLRIHDIYASGVTYSGNAYMGAITVRADNSATISDVRIENCKTLNTSSFGIATHGHTSAPGKIRNLFIDNCTVEDSGRYDYNRMGNWTVGFCLSHDNSIENVTVTNCYAKRCWESGFYMEDGKHHENVLIMNCIAEDNGIDKPTAQYGTGFFVYSGVAIQNCHSKGNDRSGFLMLNGGSIKDCIIDGENVSQYGIDADDTPPVTYQIEGNTIKNTTSLGMYIQAEAVDSSICGNYFYSCNNYGMRMNNMSSSRINGNIVSKIRWGGIYVDGGNNLTISDNLVHNIGQAGNGFGILTNSRNSVIANNQIIDDQAVKTHQNAIGEQSEAQGNLIIGNYISGCSSTKIVVNSDSVLRDNYGIDDTSYTSLSSQTISGGHMITSYTPIANTDVANKAYVDAGGAGTFHPSGIVQTGTDYIIWTDGSTYYTKPGSSGSVSSNSNPSGASNVFQYAIDQLSTGGSINVHNGDYYISSTITLDDNISLIGNGGAKLFLATGSNCDIINVSGKDDVLIQGLELDGNKENQLSGSNVDGIELISDSKRVTIRDCYIHDTYRNGVRTHNETLEVIVDGCRFVDCGRETAEGGYLDHYPAGIYLRGVKAQAVNNYIENCIGVGIATDSTDEWKSSMFIIANNILTGKLGHGIHIEGGTPIGRSNVVSIHNNIIYNISSAHYQTLAGGSQGNNAIEIGDGAYSCTISDNIISGMHANNGDGIYCSAEGVVIANNNITKARVKGINCISDHAVVDGNVLTRVESEGIRIDGDCTTVANNVLYHCNETNVAANSYCIRGNNASAKHNKIIGNTILGTASGGINFEGESQVIGNIISGSGKYYGLANARIISNNKISNFNVGSTCKDNAIFEGNIIKNIKGNAISVSNDDNVIISDNLFIDCGTTNNTFTLFVGGTSKNVSVENNIISGTRGIDLQNTANYISVIGNHLQDCPTNPLRLQTTGTDIKIRNNFGYVTENHGWSDVSDGGTIAHGLNRTPRYVNITPSGNAPIAYSTKVDSSNITVYHTSGGTITVSWEARY